MSETDLVSTAAPRKRGLTGMVLAELRQLAGELNIPDTSGMRKGDLIAAIKERQAGAPVATAAQLPLPDAAEAPAASNGAAPAAAPTRRRRAASRPAGAPDLKPATNGSVASAEAPAADAPGVDVPAAAPAVETPSPAPETAAGPGCRDPRRSGGG